MRDMFVRNARSAPVVTREIIEDSVLMLS